MQISSANIPGPGAGRIMHDRVMHVPIYVDLTLTPSHWARGRVR